jgi:predicted CoA-substrate-specific enzyme activase
MITSYRLGIDIGSTTAKIVILDREGNTAFQAYRRHNTEIHTTLQNILNEAIQILGDIPLDILITGSAGMGLSEKFHIPFVQEVVASAEVVRQRFPEVHTLIDIGGEDAKMIFFNGKNAPDIRMNGSCAGGTGAFIDQMATLLDIPVEDINSLAASHSSVHPIASRCGVFAKTDVQNLLSREIPRQDIAASIFYAVVLQTLTTLARGCDPTAKILFSGGPLTFLPILREQFIQVLELQPQDVVHVDNGELLTAMGAALSTNTTPLQLTITQFLTHLENSLDNHNNGGERLPALFRDMGEQYSWENSHGETRVPRGDIRTSTYENCYMGIDSGSTTTKIVLIDDLGRILFEYYRSNQGRAIQAVRSGLEQIRELFKEIPNKPKITRCVVTGYGEDLIRSAFGSDEGIVETLAHYRAAIAFNPKVSFILDIGGQDMKAIFVENGKIRNIEINEACSSGCGSFLEAFARSMGYEVGEFARSACQSNAPCDLGTRCTVFMNSKVKQALREGAEISDISAGLAYSVIKNAIHKVLKITNTDVLGEHIVVQGGTFRNPAVHRAMETLLEKPVTCPDIPELMGAFGAALTALDTCREDKNITDSNLVSLDELDGVSNYQKKHIHCNGCENQCLVTCLTFVNGQTFFTGNRCERIFSNRGAQQRKGINHPARKYELCFDRPTRPPGDPKLIIGIPRVLNIYENYPFWNALLIECGFEIRLSGKSEKALYEKGALSVMSENICFPAKLAHGHIIDLIEAGVDRIFYPMVFFEEREFSDALNTYNCPIVSGYPDVIRSAIDPQDRWHVPFDQPEFTYADEKLLQKNCYSYLHGLGIDRYTFKRAFKLAVKAQMDYKNAVRREAERVIQEARAAGRQFIVLLGRPYHIDPLINHRIPDMITDFGMDVITEDGIPLPEGETLDNQNVLTQWAYPNRYYHAAHWIGQQTDAEVIQVNSFACGPDAIAVDEVKYILREYGRSHTVIRVDEIESPGSVRLRLRSMFESMKWDCSRVSNQHHPRISPRLFLENDRRKLILAPEFSRFCTAPLARPLMDFGYRLEMLPPVNRQSVEVGLKYTNNEICFPAIILIGDLIKSLQSGKYNLQDVAVGITQTGGPCRASSYLSLLKKALTAAGFEDIPIVSISSGVKGLHEQPGFKMDIKQYYYKSIISMLYADSLSTLYHATAVRAIKPELVEQLADHYMDKLASGELPLTRNAVMTTLEQAVGAFNSVPTCNDSLPKVGIIGEIYAKYNHFSNLGAAAWLMKQKIEVVVPSLLEFFSSWFIGPDIYVRSNLKRPNLTWMAAQLGSRYVQHLLGQVNETLAGFRYYSPGHSIQDIARKAQRVITLAQQYGEGWLLAGEIGTLVKEGVNNILCLQPFGCIANQVVVKGVEKRMKHLYPDLNLLFLDVDAGVSEVNYYNRMYFFVDNARRMHQSNTLQWK